ncbi:uncharacterized protein XM38_036200 [Halomicronema hongdechloris C2206]|uniref:Uncharacterized protein n=1 Tax=Halomicronema hongdechloris C2206 TaxID=1641165 RepID=A0A1Z3HQY5_9CYAN|nr:hypothetical protein [Halomicronema hongdechloris]ASC72662.1 uncharacterized protein XM38_036200 [Halomicronema hongdechloris C2206]
MADESDNARMAGKRVCLPDPDKDNITVLTSKLPNAPILPWHRYDSPWLEQAAAAVDRLLEATEDLSDEMATVAPDVDADPMALRVLRAKLQSELRSRADDPSQLEAIDEPDTDISDETIAQVLKQVAARLEKRQTKEVEKETEADPQPEDQSLETQDVSTDQVTSGASDESEIDLADDRDEVD